MLIIEPVQLIGTARVCLHNRGDRTDEQCGAVRTNDAVIMMEEQAGILSSVDIVPMSNAQWSRSFDNLEAVGGLKTRLALARTHVRFGPTALVRMSGEIRQCLCRHY